MMLSRLIILCITGVLTCSFYGRAQKDNTENQLNEALLKGKTPAKKFELILSSAKFYQTTNVALADSLKNVLISTSIVLNDSSRLAALLFKADMESITGDRSSYFSTVLSCQPFINRVNNDNIQVEILKHLANYHILNKETEMAVFYLKRMVRMAKSIDSKQYLAEANLLLSKNHTLNTKMKDSALYYINTALQFARRTPNKILLADCFHQQSLTYKAFGQLDLSAAKDILALQIATEIKNYRQVAIYSLEIGRVQFTIHNVQDAEYYYKQALDESKNVKDDNLYANSLVELANVYFTKKQYNEAIKNCLQAITLFEKLNNREGLGASFNTLGMIYREQKEFNHAGTQFNHALVNYESIGDLQQIAVVYHNVATVFYANKKYENALNYLFRSIDISKTTGANNQLYENYRLISTIYRDLGQTKKALDYLQIYVNYIDSNATEQSLSKIAELNELYRAEQRDRLILSQADSIDKQRQQRQLTATQLENIKLRNTFQIYVIIGFILLIIMAIVIVRNRWIRDKIRQQQRETEMAQTLLRAQMNPHFVFNAMSVIQSYIYENDTKNSAKFLVNFSRLMRLILENSPKDEIPIQLEVEILQKYLETQKMRFENRFEFSINVEGDLEHEKAMIPPMITQPFIENAIEHGQLHTIDGGFIRITFRKKLHMLEIIIEDNGIGRKGAEMNKKSREHKSMAMNITRERIENLNRKYRTEGFLKIEDYNKTLETGTKIVISLPYRVEAI
ncbi:MAG: tetratricopeptide repeat protein [Crocinitomicaceae bacterium]|nr:tetratricopeptide repeat protein [Crocinitomicaceae bacterium]